MEAVFFLDVEPDRSIFFFQNTNTGRSHGNIRYNIRFRYETWSARVLAGKRSLLTINKKEKACLLFLHFHYLHTVLIVQSSPSIIEYFLSYQTREGKELLELQKYYNEVLDINQEFKPRNTHVAWLCAGVVSEVFTTWTEGVSVLLAVLSSGQSELSSLSPRTWRTHQRRQRGAVP